VKAFFDVDLDKGQTRTDWSQRPLDAAQLNYAADDVRYLIKLYPLIQKQLETDNRQDWLNDDFTALTDVSLYKIDEQTIWKKVNGCNRLKGVQLAILQQLAAWREQQAIKRDKPRKWIMSNDVLITLARTAPTNTAELEKIRGLSENYIKHNAESLLDIIKQAQNIPKDKWPIIKIKQATAAQDTLVDLLMTALRLQTQKNNISTAIIATRKDIEKLVMGERELPVIQGWRKHIVGQTLLDVIEGKLSLKVEDDQVILEPC
ncbi:MAG: HRDC domain-containing protein, partial [Gammaproteobacteria bacterium]|nr:HRDC domain-containing protein [Gammaproteobacteria bacterium]